MLNNMSATLQGLYITIVGMGLLFLALGLILVAINILSRAVEALSAHARRPPEVSPGAVLPRGFTPPLADQQGQEDETLRRARVAAIAVALALAKEPVPIAGTAPIMPGLKAGPEAWVILGRQSQMAARQRQ